LKKGGLNMENSKEPKSNTTETLNMLTTFVDDAEIGLYVTDFYTCEVLFVNRKMALYSGENDTSVFIGKPCWKLINAESEDRCPFCPYEKLLDENGIPTEPYNWELYIPHSDMWLKVINRIITWKDDRLAQLVTFYDITEMKKTQDKLANLAYIDRLLHVKNELMLEQEIEKTAEKLSLIVFDILALQKINVTYGRNIGDCLLISIRDWIVSQKINNSELYRIGGDEFCVAVENAGEEELKLLADAILRRFTEPWIVESDGNKLQIFCGVTIAIILNEYIHAGEPLLNLLERTLKTARERKMITVYNEKMDKEYKERLKFELVLKRCTRENMDGFNVYYQPISEPCGGKWRGLEALCRWNSPEFGRVSPELFIPEAERLELIGVIGYWVLETAVSQCKRLGLDKLGGFILHVNLSSAQFADETLASKIINILKKYDYPESKLCVEITESTQFTFTGQSLDTINKLRANNVLVALDDFGTGYANYYQLKSIPADILKIERALVSDIQNGNYTRYLFHAMTDLAHTVNMKLIAEGVENKEQMDILTKNGADYLQGYLFSKPLPLSDLENMLYLFDCYS